MRDMLIEEAVRLMYALDEENLREFISYLRFLRDSEDSSQPVSDRHH